jgi:Icc protein
MKDEIRIAQISDIHVTKEQEMAYGIDVRKNFIDIYESLAREKDSFDELLITGDLCFREGEKDIYKWIRSYLDSLNKSYHVIPGNHDDLENIKDVFEIPSEYIHDHEIYYEYPTAAGTIFFLDTSSGSISKKQMNWLAARLRTIQKECMLVMHHPPVISDIRYMEKNYALQNQNEFYELLISYPDIRFLVCCGHYHAEKAICTNNILTLIAPTGFFQIDQAAETFKIDSYRVGWRNIKWSPSSLKSTVRYIS